MRLSDGTRLGPYEIGRLLAAGGMGEVYRARDPRLGREVAVKIISEKGCQDPDRLRRFEQEARAAGALNHPNVITIYDVGSQDGTPYVVSELLEGETLRALIGAGSLPTPKAVDYGTQIARGLAAAHAKGIVHRDLKPDNVFVTVKGQVKILDFGLAKLRDGAPEPGASPAEATASGGAVDYGQPYTGTQPGVRLGTVGYMSPEQVRGLPIDHRSDIFSLGSILFEMLTGRRTFKGDSDVETMTSILKDEPADLPRRISRTAPSLERIGRRCLAKRPDERFQSAQDIAYALEALSTMAPRAVRRRTWPMVFRVAVLLALAIVGRLLYRPGSGPLSSPAPAGSTSGTLNPSGAVAVGGSSSPSIPTGPSTCNPGEFTVANARLEPPVFNCTLNENHMRPLKYHVEAKNNSSVSVTINSISSAMECVNHSEGLGCRSFKDGNLPYTPTSVQKKSAVTIVVIRGGKCGLTPLGGFIEWRGFLTIQTSCGSFTLQTENTNKLVFQ